jgi:hypothetical protein
MSTPSAAILSRSDTAFNHTDLAGAERNRSGPFVCGSAPGEAGPARRRAIQPEKTYAVGKPNIGI